MDDSVNPFIKKLWQMVGLPKRWSQRLDAFFDPRLGKLFHYPPRPLVFPKEYNKVKGSLEQCLTISIVTPCFQGQHYLEETIQSVIDQRYPNLEYCIQDGGSNDDSINIIKKHEEHLHYWDSRQDNGQSQALNRGFVHTQGEVMAYLNADDLLLPGSLHYVSDFFIKNPDVDVIYGHRILIDSQSNEIGRWVMPSHCHYTITWHDFIPQETLFWRRSIWDKAGGYIDESKQFAMDWELIMRLREVRAKFVRLPRFLGAFRVHDEMKSIQNLDTVGVEEMNLIRAKYRTIYMSDKKLEKHIRTYLKKHIVLDKLYKAGLLRF